MEKAPSDPVMQPLKREKVSDVVVQVIRDYIAKNSLEPGDKLPSERELAASLNVGTRSVREALSNLEARGVVRIEHGRGTFVDEKYRDDFAQFLADSLELGSVGDQEMLLDLMYVRKIIETSAVADAANRLSEEGACRLSEIVEMLKSASADGDIESYNRIDILLHKTIVGLTENRILKTLYDRLSDLFARSFAKTGYLPGSPYRSLREHTDLVESILAGDVESARKQIRLHLESTTESLRAQLPGRTDDQSLQHSTPNRQ